ncbi:hypothetical protein [Streptococcus hyointestinalis]|uniref:hypothetical protein n=1 Tax=Streptococcus hyointestinalis TaxID=1337 RepID=UPI0013E0BE0B|nr:hypothetical protein [Streptococcus hyointestinalis]
MITPIKEYIEFGHFNTKDYGLYLESRNAPTPEEKEIIEDIPLLQGVLDFSMILGERIFKTREIEYEFKLPNTAYEERKVVERRIKQLLMSFGEQKLYDTHDNGYFWLGKCKSVSVKHDPGKRNFIATIIFTVYPFMFTLSNYFDDVWDSFDFDDGIAGFTKYTINGSKELTLINTSDNTVAPEVAVSSAMTLELDGSSYDFLKGTATHFVMGLKPGINKIKVTGNGTVSIRWNAEVMG